MIFRKFIIILSIFYIVFYSYVSQVILFRWRESGTSDLIVSGRVKYCTIYGDDDTFDIVIAVICTVLRPPWLSSLTFCMIMFISMWSYQRYYLTIKYLFWMSSIRVSSVCQLWLLYWEALKTILLLCVTSHGAAVREVRRGGLPFYWQNRQ